MGAFRYLRRPRRQRHPAAGDGPKCLTPVQAIVMPESDVFTAIASPVRRALLDALREGPQAVHELADGSAISRPAVSQHLAVLLGAELVTEHRVGRERRYRLDPSPLRKV